MMTWFSLLIVTVIILVAKPTFSISHRFHSSNFPPNSRYSLLGDAHFVDGGESVRFSRTTTPNFGIILRSTPYKFTPSTSFSSKFTFEIGSGIALVIIPADFPSKYAKNAPFEPLDVNRFLGIVFDINVCKISSSRVSNVSKINHVLKEGVNLSSWIDYVAILHRLDVRVSKLGDPRPAEPLISLHIDLGEILKGEDVLLGLASSTGHPEQITTVYSWTSEMKEIPKWLHSIPVIPKGYSSELRTSKKRRYFLLGFIFAAGCGALTALALFFASSYVADKKKAQEESSVHPVDFKYEKIGVLEVKDSESGMK